MAFVTKAAKMAGMISGYMAQASAGKVLIRDHDERLRFFVENVSRWCQKALNIMDFEVECVGLDKIDLENKNYLFVANHMSYLDVLLFSSKIPSVFVTSVDMGEVFFLGTLAEMGGSIFVERRNRQKVDRDLGTMTDTLKRGFNIVIFPEGTSTDGQKLLPFKKSLLMSAVDAKKEIVPVAIKYMSIDGKPFCKENADSVCWYGDMTFADHLTGLWKYKSIKVQIEFLSPISTEVKVEGERIRTELAEKSWLAIQEAYFRGREVPFGEQRPQMNL